MRLHSCPTCTCTTRRRYIVTDELLEAVAIADANGGVDQVADDFNRSRSQAYRLIALAKERQETHG